MYFFIILITALVALCLVALVVGFFRHRYYKKKLERGEINEMPGVEIPDAECCGQHETCEKDSLLAAVSKDIEYYDDESLDNYRGTPAEAYTPEQIEEFEEVLYTMRNEEVAGWVRSLQLRGIELPNAIKDEVFLIIGERRWNQTT
jgi:hypothetical protein